jgi:hypothetical protein
MLPLAWSGAIFPASFWTMALYNWRVTALTIKSVAKRGIDATAKLQQTKKF